MGTWGTGLYASDVAADLKATVTSVLRLPMEPAALVELLSDQEPSLADPESEDHTGCWFVVADQFWKYGVDHQPTFERVLRYIKSGQDLEMMRQLGLSPQGLRAREKTLDAFANRISVPNPKPFRRRILNKPQAQVTTPGEVLVFPVGKGRSANPYFKSWDKERFVPDGHGAALVLRTGHSFGYLAWTCLSMLDSVWPALPSIEDCLDSQLSWPGYGTFSKTHYKRMGINPLVEVTFSDGVSRLRPDEAVRSGDADYTTTNDISICNVMSVPSVSSWSGGSRDLSKINLREVVSDWSLRDG